MGADLLPGEIAPVLAEEEAVYAALVLGVRDYVAKNGFRGAVLGLAGGIDSALALCIAVDALGPAEVEAVLMPSRYTAAMTWGTLKHKPTPWVSRTTSSPSNRPWSR